MKLVGRVARAALEGGAMVRLAYPPFDVLVAIVNGAPRAIEDACNHAGASLSEGWLTDDGARVVCPMHNYEFDFGSGECVSPKGLCDAQRTFVARVEGADVAIYEPVMITLLR